MQPPSTITANLINAWGTPANSATLPNGIVCPFDDPTKQCFTNGIPTPLFPSGTLLYKIYQTPAYQGNGFSAGYHSNPNINPALCFSIPGQCLNIQFPTNF